jgi:hypothetical protein
MRAMSARTLLAVTLLFAFAPVQARTVYRCVRDNTRGKPVSAQLLVDAASQQWASSVDDCAKVSTAPGSVRSGWRRLDTWCAGHGRDAV